MTTVEMCVNDMEIEIPCCAVDTLLSQGATIGPCDDTCCPEQTGEKIDMCLNGNDINVSKNACKGILNAGGTCGPCEEEVVSESTLEPPSEPVKKVVTDTKVKEKKKK